MNITQMKYLVEIVQSNYNITVASQKLYVSQSAISQFVKGFEDQYEVDLFVRRKGKIVALTPSGEKIYQSALLVLDKYYNLENTLKDESSQQKGTIKIGMHPTILRLFFTKFIPRFILDNPDAYIEIVEAGTLELREMLMDQTIHAAILVEPAELQPEDFEVYQLMRTEIVAFMDPNHPLSKKRLLKWSDLNDYPFATYNEKDKVYHLVNKKLETKKAKDNLLFTSASWDYMIESVVDNRHMAILPTIYFSQFISRVEHIGVVEKRFEDPISYIPVLARPKKKVYAPVESFVFNSILENFHFDDHTLRYDFLEEF